MKRLTREWVRKAEADYRAAELLDRGSDPLHDQACFHCQQCAEKYLKALLEEAGALLGLSRATAYRNWAFARAWLRDALTSVKKHADRETD